MRLTGYPTIYLFAVLLGEAAQFFVANLDCKIPVFVAVTCIERQSASRAERRKQAVLDSRFIVIRVEKHIAETRPRFNMLSRIACKHTVIDSIP